MKSNFRDLKAGQELDRLILEKVLQKSYFFTENATYPAYSRNINLAMEIVEKMYHSKDPKLYEKFIANVESYSGQKAILGNPISNLWLKADPLEICQIALYAVGFVPSAED